MHKQIKVDQKIRLINMNSINKDKLIKLKILKQSIQSILPYFIIPFKTYNQFQLNLMNPSSEDQNICQSPKPIQSICAIEQSLVVLQQKLTQISKRQSEITQQIQKVFYSSIPNLKNKLSQTIESQKVHQKKKMLFNENVLRQKKKINLQRKMINQKEIERNKELLNIMKINQHNEVKERSRKNQILIEKMKNFRILQNKKKKELVKGSLQHSRNKIQDFHIIKMDEIRREKQEEELLMRKKIAKMQKELQYLGDKENETFERVDKSEEALRHLRHAVDKMQKMNQNEFIRLKNKIEGETPHISEEKLIEKMLMAVVESQKLPKTYFHSRKIFHSKWSSEHLTNLHRG